MILLHPPPPQGGRGGAPRRGVIGAGRLVAATLASAVLGAAALAAILFAAGAVRSDGASDPARPAGPGPPVGGSGSLHPVALYARAVPGVVDIAARSSTTVASPLGPARQLSTSTGSGMVVDRRGHVLTADHVVRGSSSVRVTFADGATRTARILGQDPSTDIAVLGVDPSGPSLHPLTLGDSAALQVGDPVAAIGDPFGYKRSMSVGIVSGLDRAIQGLDGSSVGHAVQTDAALDPGNSGGPLLDAHGDVIGIVDQIATGNSDAQNSTGVGFAISSNVARAELSALARGAAPAHAYLGVQTAPAVEVDGARGVVVVAVQKGSPAAKAGVRAGDIVDAVGGKPLRGVNDLIATVAADRPGQAMTLTVRRGARRLTLRVVLGAQPKAPAGSTP